MSDKLHRDSMFLCSKVGVRSSGDPSLELVVWVSTFAWGVGQMALLSLSPTHCVFAFRCLPPCLRVCASSKSKWTLN
jgi:hypothetical protein